MSDSSRSAFKVRFACSLWQRLKGLLPQEPVIEPGEVLVLVPCCDIHTFCMTAPIDVAFVDKRGVIIKACTGLKPGKRMHQRGAVCVIERMTPVNESAEKTAFEIQDCSGWFKEGERLLL